MTSTIAATSALLVFYLCFYPAVTWAFVDMKGAAEYIKQAVDAAQNIYETYESVIDEECLFDYCQGDPFLKSVPNPDHVPEYNGCGTINFLLDSTPASPVRLDDPLFTDCCNEHDLCYDTCGADRDLCDLKFRKCLYAVCREKNFLRTLPCKTQARSAWLLVQALGCPNYRESQKKACICVRDTNNNRNRKKKDKRDEL